MRELYRVELKWSNDMLCITVRSSRCVSKKSSQISELVGFPGCISAHTGVPTILLYRERSGSPSQRIHTIELQLPIDSLSYGCSGYVSEHAGPASPSLLSSLSPHNIQKRVLSPTKYTRMPPSSESSAVRFSNAGESMIFP